MRVEIREEQMKVELSQEKILSEHRQLFFALVLIIFSTFILAFVFLILLGSEGNGGQGNILGVSIPTIIGLIILLCILFGLIRSISLYRKTRRVGFFIYIIIFIVLLVFCFLYITTFIIKSPPSAFIEMPLP